MKIKLELLINEAPDGRVFLNYWDAERGDDVCVEIKDGKLIAFTDGIGEHDIPLQDFIDAVKVSLGLPPSMPPIEMTGVCSNCKIPLEIGDLSDARAGEYYFDIQVSFCKKCLRAGKSTITNISW